ncbi:MAG: hypothetical protein QY323_05775 [Patescibacteria group bacterium]|nr:MAG: hypothetical protein QY323_05775 [Patescibacteria group bacterium]
MPRARRTSEQHMPVEPAAEKGMGWDLSDTQPVEMPVTPAKKTRRKASSKSPVTSETRKEVSGEIELTDADLKEMTVDEPMNDNEPYAELTITPAAEAVPAAAPRKKRARRVEMSSETLAKKASADDAAAKAAAKEKRMADMGTRVDAAMETEEEEAWFKKGEDASHVAALAESQQAEDALKMGEVRKQIAASYDSKKTDTVIDTDEEVEAAAAQAEEMLARNELNSEVFNAKDYRYLLIEKARLDRELESAGWWQARKLRAELRETQKSLADYEQQIMRVYAERRDDREQAAKPPQAPWQHASRLPEGSGTSIHKDLKEGSGTTIHKPGFFARLFGKK